MIRKYIIEADDSFKGFDEEIARLEREWGAEEIEPCVSEGVCREDEIRVLDKIRAKIENHCGLAKEDRCKYCYRCNNVMGVKEILDIIDKYKTESEEQPKTGEWIPVSERLPKKTGKYLVTVRNGNVYAGTFDETSGRFQCAATAWMPLPEPYQSND